MNYFKAGYGLVTKHDPVTENCNLFYAQYLALKNPHERSDFNFFTINMVTKWNRKHGVYNRRSGYDTRSVSHDEITGWMVSSYLLQTSHKDSIWHHLKTHFGAYNNTGKPLDYLPFNPANYYAWGELVGAKYHKIFLPFYLINLLIASSKDKMNTSSKIIYWLELSVLPKTWVNQQMKAIFERKMKAQYGEHWLRGLYEIYFASEDRNEFPLWKELLRND